MRPLATEILQQLRRRIGAERPSIAPGASTAGTTGGGSSASITGRDRSGSSQRAPGTFTGAVLPICGVEVLIVVVHPSVLANIHEANLYVVAFHERFRRTIVLMAQAPGDAPRLYGPTDILRVLQRLPCEMIPWRRLLFRTAPPPSWRLPIPRPRGNAGREGIDLGSRGALRVSPASAGVGGSTGAAGSAAAGDADLTVNGRAGRAIHLDRVGSADRTTGN